MQIVKKQTSSPLWSSAICFALVCVRVGGWKKASKCENMIEQFQTHLIIYKKRRHVIVKQSRADIALLLQYDNFDRAFAKVEQLYKDTCLLTAYDQIDNFCECIITNMSNISKCSSIHNLPTKVAVAISSLTYAASRCGELSSLNQIRNLFRERYGSKFDIANVELCVGNYVDLHLRENLSIYSVPEDKKLMLLNEIAQDQDLKQNHDQQL